MYNLKDHWAWLPLKHFFSRRQEIKATPDNFDFYLELADFLLQKNKAEESIPHLQDILAIDWSWQQKKAYNKITEVFKKLG